MKRILLGLAFIALSVCANAQGITASNGTVVVKQGTVSVLGGITGTFVASGTGTTVISGTPTVVVSSGTLTATFPSTNLTMTSTSVTASGTVTAGAKAVVFETSGDFVGNIDGIAADADTPYPFTSGDSGTLPAISYTITTGSIRIRKLQ